MHCLVSRLVVGLSLLSAHQLASQQNMLILVADDLGVDHIGAYQEGASPPPTPNIDALAARGLLFRNAWSYPYCSPTRSILHTGRYGFRTGVGFVIYQSPPPAGQNALGLEEWTLPELLDTQGTGYAHAATGKWHLSDVTNGGTQGPNLAGWSHFAGLLPSDGLGYYNWPRTVNGTTQQSTSYQTSAAVDDALAWIQSVPEPWICRIGFLAPHTPYHTPPANLHTQQLAGENPNVNPIPFYKAMVEAMDTEIGRLFNTLGSEVMARTNVVFLSDNGTPIEAIEPPFNPNHGKGTLYEGGVNVPLVIAGPAVTTPRETPALVSIVDIFATVVELCGGDPTVPFVRIDSRSLRPILDDSTDQVRSTVFSEVFFLDPATTGGVAVRNAQFKLIRNMSTATDELYDLVNDPFEATDLIALGPLDPVQQAAYNALSAEIANVRDTSGSVQVYGQTTCAGSNGMPAIDIFSGPPALGSTYTVALTNAAPSQTAFLLIGGSRTRWGPLPLPFPLTALGGGPGCFIHAKPDARIATTTSATGDASIDIPLPNVPLWIGGAIHHTWLIVDPTAPNNNLGLTASDGATAFVGS